MPEIATKPLSRQTTHRGGKGVRWSWRARRLLAAARFAPLGTWLDIVPPEKMIMVRKVDSYAKTFVLASRMARMDGEPADDVELSERAFSRVRMASVPDGGQLVPPLAAGPTTVGSEAGSAKTGAPSRPQPETGRTVDANGNVTVRTD